MLCIHDIFYRKRMIEISNRNNCPDVLSDPESPLKMEKPQTIKSAAFSLFEYRVYRPVLQKRRFP